MTKLGPHTLNSSPQAAQWARAGAPVVKMVGDFSFAAEAAALPHKPLVIGRWVETYLDPNRLIDRNPVDEARAYVATFLERHIRLNPSIAAWEGPNECVITELPAMRWYAAFLHEFARILRESYNKTAVIGNWSVGNPDYPMWADYGPALEAVRRYGAILGRHSYAGPDASTWGHLLMRHREDHQIFSNMGYPNLPVVLTESGADGVPYGVPPGRAWKDLYGDDAERYCREILIPFDNEIRLDPYVLGAVVFTSGGSDTWPAHNIDGRVSEILIAHTMASELPPPVPDGATHVVTAILLNVRGFPWAGTIVPPRVDQLVHGNRVRVFGTYRDDDMLWGWACINTHGNAWVSMKHLEPL